MATAFFVILWPFLVAAVILWCSYRADTAPFRKTRSASNKRSKLHGEILDLKMRLNASESDNRVLQRRYDALHAALDASLKRDLKKARESSKPSAGIDFDGLLEIERQPKKVLTPSGRCWCNTCRAEVRQHSYTASLGYAPSYSAVPEEPEPPVFFANGLQIDLDQYKPVESATSWNRRKTVEPPSSGAIDSRWIEPPGRKPWLKHEDS